MKIIFQYFVGGGGATASMLMLLRALSKNYPEDDIVIVCSDRSQLLELESLSNVEVVTYGGSAHQEVNRLRLGLYDLRRIAVEKKADVVWSMNLGSYSKLPMPHVISINNAYQVYPIECAKFHPKGFLNVLVLRLFFWLSIRVSTIVIAQTSLMARYLTSFYPGRECVVIPKAVEGEFDCAAMPLPDNIASLFSDHAGSGQKSFKFLYVATATPHKNHALIVDLFERLATLGSNAKVFLTITEDELLSLSGDRARMLLDAGYVVPIGWVDKCYLRALYECSDACIMPSFLESLSSAHLEAMHWKRPQVVADLPYAHDICGDAALYASPMSVDAWVTAVNRLIGDHEIREELVKRGVKRMSEFPDSWDEVAANIHSVLTICCKRA